MEKKIFNVATYKRDHYLLKTIESIYDQADVINIALNSHTIVPTELCNDAKINCYITNNSIGDGFKFLKLNDSNGYYFTIDDDIIYPKNYSDYLIQKYMQYNNKCVVTLHGRTFIKHPITSYYRSGHYSYRCLGDVNSDVAVEFGGTGVMMFHTDLIKYDIKNILHPNMADVWMGKFANEMNIKIMCVAHNKNYLSYQDGVGCNTIFDNSVNRDVVQTNIVNEIFK